MHAINLVARKGFEPLLSDSESLVLPLHYQAGSLPTPKLVGGRVMNWEVYSLDRICQFRLELFSDAGFSTDVPSNLTRYNPT
ncbi:MAG: hypothetical protein JWP89_2750 [Schlesneria sp.]|nr:hypothetical protein [Schlesneria sp.]